MKILQFTNFYPPPFAGTERYIMDVTAGLVKMGHKVHIVYAPIVYNRKNVSLKYEPPAGATLSYVPDRFGFLKLYREVKKFDPDVIQTYYLKTAFRAEIIGSILKKPVVCSVFLADEKTKTLSRKIGLWLMRSFFRKIHYIVVSDEIGESIKKDIPGARVKMIPCWTWNHGKMAAADGSAFRKKFPKNAKIFMTASRIVEEKGIRQLIYAAQEAVKQRGNIYFAVIGTGAMLEEYKSLVKQLDIDKKFIFLGRVSDRELLSTYKGCDAVVLPFIVESSFAVTESLVVGKPIIANRNRSIEEIMENGKDAILEDIKKPAAFSRALLKVIDNPDLRKKLVENAGKRGMDFSPERCMKQIEDVYESLAAD